MIRVRYIYDWDWEHGGWAVPWTRELPSKKAKLSGNWKEINGEIYVGVLEKSFFRWKEKFISETEFTFTEVEEFSCQTTNG